MFYTADKETGTFIEKANSIKEGLEMIAAYEHEDKADDIYEPDFYTVVDEDHSDMLN